MELAINITNPKEKMKSLVFDILAVSFLYFFPVVSHLISFPVYLIEPMRIVIILSIAHTMKNNSFLLALTVPVFSFLISSHPSLIKTALISFELLLNVSLFFFLTKRNRNQFFNMLISIIASKIYYYGLKYLLIKEGFIKDELVSTPFQIQLIIAVIFSFYIYIIPVIRKKFDPERVN